MVNLYTVDVAARGKPAVYLGNFQKDLALSRTAVKSIQECASKAAVADSYQIGWTGRETSSDGECLYTSERGL